MNVGCYPTFWPPSGRLVSPYVGILLFVGIRDTSLDIHRDNVLNQYEDIVLHLPSIKYIFLDHMREKMSVYKITLMQDMQGAYA